MVTPVFSLSKVASIFLLRNKVSDSKQQKEEGQRVYSLQAIGNFYQKFQPIK